MISVQNLTKQYRRHSVVDIEQLSIGRGESFGLVGNNGAGKTTLFRMLLDLIRPTQGEILIQGENVRQSEAWKHYVGSFLDENFLINYLTPEEYFQFLAGLYHYTEADLQEYLALFSDLFNNEVLGHKKYIRDLSKGNLKKVGIAAALMGNPEVVILDEPFENLDPSSQIRLKNLLKQIRTERHVTYLISSHDLNHVTEVCDRIVILEKGKVVQDINDTENMLEKLEAYFKA